jgi:hypothetical protein
VRVEARHDAKVRRRHPSRHEEPDHPELRRLGRLGPAELAEWLLSLAFANGVERVGVRRVLWLIENQLALPRTPHPRFSLVTAVGFQAAVNAGLLIEGIGVLHLSGGGEYASDWPQERTLELTPAGRHALDRGEVAAVIAAAQARRRSAALGTLDAGPLSDEAAAILARVASLPRDEQETLYVQSDHTGKTDPDLAEGELSEERWTVPAPWRELERAALVVGLTPPSAIGTSDRATLFALTRAGRAARRT